MFSLQMCLQFGNIHIKNELERDLVDLCSETENIEF